MRSCVFQMARRRLNIHLVQLYHQMVHHHKLLLDA